VRDKWPRRCALPLRGALPYRLEPEATAALTAANWA
jgi:hypothetical protein